MISVIIAFLFLLGWMVHISLTSLMEKRNEAAMEKEAVELISGKESVVYESFEEALNSCSKDCSIQPTEKGWEAID